MDSKNTTIIHLLIDNAYIEEFMQKLPKDKVIVIEEDFKQNKKLYENSLKEYLDDDKKFTTYYESMA
jgi:hypothetical protein